MIMGCVCLLSPASFKSNRVSGNISVHQRKVEGMTAKRKSCCLKAPWHCARLSIHTEPDQWGCPWPATRCTSCSLKPGKDASAHTSSPQSRRRLFGSGYGPASSTPRPRWQRTVAVQHVGHKGQGWKEPTASLRERKKREGEEGEWRNVYPRDS